MYNTVINRNVPIYSPFFMCFLKSVWEVPRTGEALSSSDKLTVHEIKQLGKKKIALPHIPPDDPKDVFATSSDCDFDLKAKAKPSWVTKLTDKVRNTFVLQVHVQKKLYNAHVNNKLATRKQIQIMWALHIQKETNSQKVTTLEKWIYVHSNWTDDEASGHPAVVSFSPAADDIMEDDDEPEVFDYDEDERAVGR
ncbi:hypothetical protein D1007_25573 [Hordeum vulgare]|nr:hypothetical protein D1007_25573 [Hordeum vulgare]